MFRLSTLLSRRPNFIKLTTAMAALTVVVALVLPIANDHVKRGHRANARAALSNAAQWMERTASAQGRYPSYLESVRKGRRAEARAALANLIQQQERHLMQNTKFVVFPAGATGTPFRTHSASSGNLADSSNLLGARRCMAVGGTVPEERDCIEVFAVPRTVAMADPAAADIAVDSLGRRRCNGSAGSLKPCWP